MKTARAGSAALAALVLAASFFSAAFAAPAKDDVDTPPDFGLEPRQHDYALVIGIEKYRDIEAASAYSAEDATLVKAYLKSLGFRESNIRLMVNDRATLTDLNKGIRWLQQVAKPDGQVFVYYSGHGSPDLSDPEHPRAFLLPYDGDPNDLQSTGYAIDRLYEGLGKLPSNEVIVVLDSCFSGAGGRSVLAKGARPLVSNIVPVGAIAPRMAVLTATQPNQISTSSPERRHGILTYHFLKSLHEGQAALVPMFKKIKAAVEDEAHALGVTQSPNLMLGSGAGETPFALAAGLDIALARAKKEEAEKAEQKRLSEEKRLADEAKRMEEEKKRLAAAQEESDRQHRAEVERLRREAAEKEWRQREEFEREKRRLESQRKREEPTFVPPTF